MGNFNKGKKKRKKKQVFGDWNRTIKHEVNDMFPFHQQQQK